MIPTGVEGVWGSDLKITKITTFDPLTGERRLKCEATPISQLNLFSILPRLFANIKNISGKTHPRKNTIRDGSGTVLYAVYTLDMVYTVYMILFTLYYLLYTMILFILFTLLYTA